MGTRLAFSGFFSSPSSSKSRYARLRARRKVELKPQCEQLEIKIAPATFTWTGAALAPFTTLWSQPDNWTHDTGTKQVPSSPGDNIVFPALGSGSKPSTNDLTIKDGDVFNSITIQGSGYSIGRQCPHPEYRAQLYRFGRIDIRYPHDLRQRKHDQRLERPAHHFRPDHARRQRNRFGGYHGGHAHREWGNR